MNFKSIQILLTIIFIFSFTNLFSQEEKEETGTANTEFIDKKDRKPWSFKLAPYAWLAGTATDVGSEQIRQSFNDLYSLTNFGFQMVAQARYKKWSLSSNLTYAKMGDKIEQGKMLIDFNIDQVILDTKIGYTVIDKIDFGDDIIRGWAMEATIGAIYWSNFINVDVNIDSPIEIPGFPTSINEKLTYVDLVFGTNFRIILSKSVLLGISANIGGFGIGNSSDLYWDLAFVNTFKVSKLLTVTAGYKTFTTKTTSVEDDEVIKTNIKTFGPLLGVTFNL
ncbi:MAG: hypothetical protein J7K34_00915 [Flavobacteriaceae bacterium]|nr:hypothetical protein [Flavobacteriaceae bacterium]